MCRIFGFRCVFQSRVQRSLMQAENALAVQSEKHPHGWGVAYYLSETPHVIKSATSATGDRIFRRIAGAVASETVLAHVRRATVGERNILNSHPFQFGRWVFAHNGTVVSFRKAREDLLEAIIPRLRPYVLGDTDSEILFYLFLSFLSRRYELERRGASVEDMASALRSTIEVVRALADERHEPSPEDEVAESILTMAVSDGKSLVALRWGKELHYSTCKSRCPDRDTCPAYTPECEEPTHTGFVNHLLVSSEPLQEENLWEELEDGEYIGVDWRMQLHHGLLREAPAPVVALP